MLSKTVGMMDLVPPADGGYDSAAETLRHVHRVRDLISVVIQQMLMRAATHDASKLGPAEKPAFDEATPQLRALTYGSAEYRESLRRLDPALKHHYASNSHHPEHFGDAGITGMSLLDLVEMLCDWKAATERTGNGIVPHPILNSLSLNSSRFEIGSQLQAILFNTVFDLGLHRPLDHAQAVAWNWQERANRGDLTREALGDGWIDGWRDRDELRTKAETLRQAREGIDAVLRNLGATPDDPTPSEATLNFVRGQLLGIKLRLAEELPDPVEDEK